MGISRQEVKERCKAVFMSDGKSVDERAPLLLRAVQGCTEYILQSINPIGDVEKPFLIVSMKQIAEALEKDNSEAGMLANMLGLAIGYKHVAIPTDSILEDAMRAMTGEGHHGREDK